MKQKKNLTEVLFDLLNNSQKLRDMTNSTEKTGIKNGTTEFVKVIVHRFS